MTTIQDNYTTLRPFELTRPSSEDEDAPNDEQLLAWFREMQLIRRFEERAAEMYTRRKIGGFLHLYIGEEAVAVGTIARLQPDDYIVSHYRDHGHALARGPIPRELMRGRFGRSPAGSRGTGGGRT